MNFKENDKARIIVRQLLSSSSDGHFSLIMLDDKLSTLDSVIFYNHGAAHVTCGPIKQHDGYEYGFNSAGNEFDWETWVEPQIGDKFLIQEPNAI